ESPIGALGALAPRRGLAATDLVGAADLVGADGTGGAVPCRRFRWDSLAARASDLHRRGGLTLARTPTANWSFAPWPGARAGAGRPCGAGQARMFPSAALAVSCLARSTL